LIIRHVCGNRPSAPHIFNSLLLFVFLKAKTTMLSTQLSGQAFVTPLPWFLYHGKDPSPHHRMASTSSERVYSPTSSTQRRRPRMTSLSSLDGHGNNRSSKPTPKREISQPRPRPRQQELKRTLLDEAKTFGEAIQSAQTISDHLFVAEKFIWLPTDENLQPHLRTQLVHHEKRRRWGSQLLEGLGQAALSSWHDSLDFKLRLLSSDDPEGKIWTDGRLVRAIMSVALPMGLGNDEEATINRPEKEGVWISAALKGLHTLSGCISPNAPSYASPPLEMQAWIDLHRGISMLIESVDELSKRSALKDAIEVRWAIRGLVVRLELANTILSKSDAKLEKSHANSNQLCVLDFTSPNLNARTSNLPFDVFSHCLPWQMSPSPSGNYYGYPTQDLLPRLLQSIPFRFDTLTTRTGNSVIERRGTAWLAEEGIGALAYSGKLMKPFEVPEIVREIMRDIEQSCVERDQRQISSQIIMTSLSDPSSDKFIELKWDSVASPLCDELVQYLQPEDQRFPTFFDCALCNHYPDGDAACKFHTDPEVS
jgi:hypothetical protein